MDKKYIAKVTLFVDSELDNYDNGCAGDMSCIFIDENMMIPFNGTKENLLFQLATNVYNKFDIGISDFCQNSYMDDVGNDKIIARFIFEQNEDGNNRKIVLSEIIPDGYLVRYEILVKSVFLNLENSFQFGDDEICGK